MQAQFDKDRLTRLVASDRKKLQTPPNSKLQQSEADALAQEIRESERKLEDIDSYLASYDERAAVAARAREEQEHRKQAVTSDINRVQNQIKATTDSLGATNRQLSDADERIANLFGKSDAANEFKKIMSAVFALLVAMVSVGFFIIAFKDENVRKAIFTNESGIQFITLFSLVIAIILFGIVDVLEGKELAALLGGLSGYILGRGTTKS